MPVIEAKPSLRQQLSDIPYFLKKVIREIQEAEKNDANNDVLKNNIISQLRLAEEHLLKKVPEIIFQNSTFSLEVKAVDTKIPQLAKPVIEGKAREQVIFKLPIDAKKPKRVLKNSVVKREEEEGDDYLFQKGNTTSLDLFFKELGKFPLLTAEQEKELGKKVFVAKLALRNIQAIFEMLSPEDNSRAEIVLKGRGKFLLNVLKSELLGIPETIMQKEERGEDNFSEKIFLEDVRYNDEFIQDKLAEFSSTEDDEIKEQNISKLASQQFAFVSEGNEAFDKFTISNLRLVIYIAKHYSDRGLALEDIIGYGQEGLITAVARFNPSKGFKFSTYAIWWIEQRISKAINDYGSAIHIPDNMRVEINKLRKKQESLINQGDGNVTFQELIETKGKNVKSSGVTMAINAAKSVLSLNEHVGDEDDSAEFGDLLVGSEGIEEETGENYSREEIEEGMSAILNERQRRVIRLRFGFVDGTGKTLEEIGKEFGITRERVRQIEEKALKRMRSSKIFAKIIVR